MPQLHHSRGLKSRTLIHIFVLRLSYWKQTSSSVTFKPSSSCLVLHLLGCSMTPLFTLCDSNSIKSLLVNSWAWNYNSLISFSSRSQHSSVSIFTGMLITESAVSSEVTDTPRAELAKNKINSTSNTSIFIVDRSINNKNWCVRRTIYFIFCYYCNTSGCLR